MENTALGGSQVRLELLKSVALERRRDALYMPYALSPLLCMHATGDSAV